MKPCNINITDLHIALISFGPTERLEAIHQLYAESDVAADCEDPIWRYAPFEHSVAVKCTKAPSRRKIWQSICTTILLYVYFDDLISSLLGVSQSPYILIDKSKPEVWTNLSPPGQLGCESSLTQVLATIGLLYRLPIATKYNYDSARYVQVRANSWARECVTRNYLGMLDAEILNNIEVLLDQHAAEYRELGPLVLSADRPLDTYKIHALNILVPISIVG